MMARSSAIWTASWAGSGAARYTVSSANRIAAPGKDAGFGIHEEPDLARALVSKRQVDQQHQRDDHAGGVERRAASARRSRATRPTAHSSVPSATSGAGGRGPGCSSPGRRRAPPPRPGNAGRSGRSRPSPRLRLRAQLARRARRRVFRPVMPRSLLRMAKYTSTASAIQNSRRLMRPPGAAHFEHEAAADIGQHQRGETGQREAQRGLAAPAAPAAPGQQRAEQQPGQQREHGLVVPVQHAPNSCSVNTIPDSTVRVSRTKPMPIRRNSSFSIVSRAGSWSSAPRASRRAACACAGAPPAAPSAPRGRRRWSGCCRPGWRPRYASRRPARGPRSCSTLPGNTAGSTAAAAGAGHDQAAQAVEREVAVFKPVGRHRHPQRGREHEGEADAQAARPDHVPATGRRRAAARRRR
jgi:hypothetical protein